MVDTNQWDNVARIYKGYFQIYVGSTPYKYDQPVEMAETVNAIFSTHYSTSGKKKLASTGFDAQYAITVDSTADLYDTASTPTDVKSISYFISKIIDNELPAIEFEGVEVTDASSNKYIKSRFKGYVVGYIHQRNTTTGTYEDALVIEITERIKVQRTSS